MKHRMASLAWEAGCWLSQNLGHWAGRELLIFACGLRDGREMARYVRREVL